MYVGNWPVIMSMNMLCMYLSGYVYVGYGVCKRGMFVCNRDDAFSRSVGAVGIAPAHYTSPTQCTCTYAPVIKGGIHQGRGKVSRNSDLSKLLNLSNLHHLDFQNFRLHNSHSFPYYNIITHNRQDPPSYVMYLGQHG